MTPITQPSGQSEELTLASALYEAKELDKSEDVLNHILASDKTSAEAWHLLGMIALMRQDLQNAQSAFDRALELNPGNADSAYYLSEVQLAAGNRDQAARYLDLALAAQPQHPTALARRKQLATLNIQAEEASSEPVAPTRTTRVPPLGLMGVRGGGFIARAMANAPAQRTGRQPRFVEEVLQILMAVAFIAIFVAIVVAAGVLAPAIAVIAVVVLFVILRRRSRSMKGESN